MHVRSSGYHAAVCGVGASLHIRAEGASTTGESWELQFAEKTVRAAETEACHGKPFSSFVGAARRPAWVIVWDLDIRHWGLYLFQFVRDFPCALLDIARTVCHSDDGELAPDVLFLSGRSGNKDLLQFIDGHEHGSGILCVQDEQES